MQRTNETSFCFAFQNTNMMTQSMSIDRWLQDMSKSSTGEIKIMQMYKHDFVVTPMLHTSTLTLSQKLRNMNLKIALDEAESVFQGRLMRSN